MQQQQDLIMGDWSLWMWIKKVPKAHLAMMTEMMLVINDWLINQGLLDGMRGMSRIW